MASYHAEGRPSGEAIERIQFGALLPKNCPSRVQGLIPQTSLSSQPQTLPTHIDMPLQAAMTNMNDRNSSPPAHLEDSTDYTYAVFLYQDWLSGTHAAALWLRVASDVYYRNLGSDVLSSYPSLGGCS
ncbi:hypothetical protein IG631_00134 [Alternaria alternata]|nr:hypothetical protein IG631_00134 [Alternaria alternata]